MNTATLMYGSLMIGLVLAVSGARVSAQVIGPLPDSAVKEFYVERAGNYAAEARAMREADGRVSRQGGRLVIRVGNGPPVILTDVIAEDGSHEQFLYHGFLSGPGLHVVELHFYEGEAALVVQDRTGSRAYVPGLPVLAPGGHRFASASLAGEAGYDPNRLEIWRATPKGLRREFVADGRETWGPDSLAWVGSDTLAYRRMVLDQRDVTWSSTPARVVRVNGHWRIR